MPTQEIDLGNVQGPKGDTGPQGPQGAQGPEGPQGPPGEFDMDAGLSFTEATTRANINTGESLKTILGKIKKFFTDLKPHAFSNPVNNLTGTDASLPLAAPQGKALKQGIDELNSALAGFKFIDTVSTGDNGSTSMTMTKNLEADNLYLVFVRHYNGPIECYAPYIHYICIRSNAWKYTTIGEAVSPDSMSIEGGKLTLKFTDTQWARMWIYKVS